MKKILSLLAFLLIALIGFSQTTPLSFTKITNDFISPNKGPQLWEQRAWDDVSQPTIPVGNAHALNSYSRFNMLDIESNTVQGSYNFSVLDAFINAAIDSGQMFSFGIMAYCGGCGGNVPSWLQTLMTTEGKPCWNDGSGFFVPNYQSTQWINNYVALYHAVANHIATTSRNGVPFTKAFLGFDMRHFDDFGEGGLQMATAPAGPVPAGAQVTDAYLIAMLDSTLTIFPNVQITVPMGYVAPQGSNYSNAAGNTGTQPAYLTLTSSNNYGRIGWRRDNIGDDGYNVYFTGNTGSFNPGTGLVQFKPLLLNNWQIAPIGGEPADDNAGVSRCGTPYCDVHNEDTLFHMDYFGNSNYPNSIFTSPTLFAQQNANMRAASLEQGYRIVLDTGTLSPSSPGSGTSISINLKVKNIGLCPVYEKWKWIYELRNGSTVVARDTSTFSPRYYLPSTSDSSITDVMALTNVAAGTYTLYLIIKDSLGYKAPLPLAISGRNADGSYTLKSGIVISSSGAPIANAGTNQTITLPTSSVTLDGTGSSGTITSYAWTLFSGPNSPSILTPTASTTVVTGLIAGTYVFKLSVNAGTSTDTMSVFVNPVIPPGTSVFTSQTPVSGTNNDNQSTVGMELGMRWKSSINGFVTGVRFYKTSGNAGTHVGELYSNTGTRLASATFTGETATGWQTVTFSSPVAVTANTLYVVSYFSSLGNYVEDNFYFATNPVVNTPLTGVIDGLAGSDGSSNVPDNGTGNGPFKYTATATFPNVMFASANYWVDVLFRPQNVAFVIGTGSGAVSLTSMTGHQPGDTALIATPTGTYTSLTLQNLNNIMVRPQTIRPTFTTQSSMCNLSNMDIGFINFMSAGNAVAIDMTCGPIDSCSFHNLYFQGWVSEAFNQSGNSAYTYGNNATYKQFRNIYDSITFFQCGRPIQGSFGYFNAAKVDVARELTLSRWNDIATAATGQEGVGYQGICFHCTAHDMRITSTTQRDPSGDVGYIMGSGWWHCWNIYKWGGPGYVIRNFGLTEYQDPGNTWITNSAKFNSTGYGLANYEFNAPDTALGQFRGITDSTYNCTLGNAEEPAILGAFWAPVVNGGQTPPGGHHIVANNFGFNIGFPVNNNGKPFIAVNEGGWANYVTDTSNNQYLLTATVAKLDSVTILFSNSLGNFQGYFITSLTGGITLHGGLTNPFRTTDFSGIPMRVPPDLGYLQFNGNAPPPIQGITNLHSGFRKVLITR